MKKQIVCIYFLIGLLLLVSCKNQGNLLFDEGRGEIRFSLVDTTEVEITTRASLNLDVNEFSVSLSVGVKHQYLPIGNIKILPGLLLVAQLVRIIC